MFIFYVRKCFYKREVEEAVTILTKAMVNGYFVAAGIVGTIISFICLCSILLKQWVANHLLEMIYPF